MQLTDEDFKDNSIIKQVWIYIRVSTFDQAINGTSLETQEAALRKWVELESDKWWVLASNGVYIDDGYSGAKWREERPAYNRLLTDIERGNINVVLVYKLDRLARSSKIIEDALLTFADYNVKFFSKDDGINNANETSKFLISIMGALAQMERTLIFERTYGWRIAKLWKWYASSWGFPLPYGYTKAEDKKIIINKDEAETVKYMYEQCAIKHKLPKDIADDLTLKKVKTWWDNKMEAEEKKQAIQGIWSADTVRKLLLNTIYKWVYYFWKSKTVRVKGEYTANWKPKYQTVTKPVKEWVKVDMPVGIVEEDLWERAREQIQKFNKLKRGKWTAYIFTGLIKCGFDGMSYIHTPKMKKGVMYHYYKCWGSNTSKMSGRKKDTDKWILIAPVCNNLQVPEKELYDKCISVIREFINEPEKLYKEKVGNSDEVQKQLKDLNSNVITYEEQLKEVNKTINWLIYKIAENPALEENYKDVVETFTRDKNTLMKTLEDTKKSIRLVEQQINSWKELKNFAKTYKDKLENLTIEQGTELIRLLVEKIEVKGTLINIFFKFKPHPESLLNNAESVKKNDKNLEVGDFWVYSAPNTKCLHYWLTIGY